LKIKVGINGSEIGWLVFRAVSEEAYIELYRVKRFAFSDYMAYPVNI
jgi:glyceraldehyde-3-phosphate dehydrogenase/erythrose-4-phosphate dehydrogenase